VTEASKVCNVLFIPVFWLVCWATAVSAQQSANVQSPEIGADKHTFRESGGAHTWIVWRRYMHEISPLLFR